MFDKIKQKILERKYNKAKDIYIVCRWIKWGVLPAKFYKINENNDLLTIYYTDHNGEFEEYIIMPWYYETSGSCIAYFFNKTEAEKMANFLNKKENLI